MHSGRKRDQNPAGVLSCEKGTVAVLFGLALIPVALAAGISIDYARALTARHQLQNAADAAAIAGARIPATANQNRANAARIAFEANLAQTPLTGVVPGDRKPRTRQSSSRFLSAPTNFTASRDRIDRLTVSTPSKLADRERRRGLPPRLKLTTRTGLHLQGINKQTARERLGVGEFKQFAAINAVGASAGKAQGFLHGRRRPRALSLLPGTLHRLVKMDDPILQSRSRATRPIKLQSYEP